MSNESKELAAKAKSFDSKKAVDLLLDNALYILMIVAVIYIQVFKNSNFLRPSSLINILSQTAAYLPLALGIMRLYRADRHRPVHAAAAWA